jgi:hypothetical protein
LTNNLARALRQAPPALAVRRAVAAIVVNAEQAAERERGVIRWPARWSA